MYFRDVIIKILKYFNMFLFKFIYFNICFSCWKYGLYVWILMEFINVIYFYIVDLNIWNVCNYCCLVKILKILLWWWLEIIKIKIYILGSINFVFYYKLNSYFLNFKVIKWCLNLRIKMIIIINSLFMGCG